MPPPRAAPQILKPRYLPPIFDAPVFTVIFSITCLLLFVTIFLLLLLLLLFRYYCFSCYFSTNYVSIILPTNDVYEAMDIFLKYRGKIVDQDIILSGGKCEINFLEIKYSDESIKPNNIIESMKSKNSVLDHLINQLKLEVK